MGEVGKEGYKYLGIIKADVQINEKELEMKKKSTREKKNKLKLL